MQIKAQNNKIKQLFQKVAQQQRHLEKQQLKIQNLQNQVAHPGGDGGGDGGGEEGKAGSFSLSLPTHSSPDTLLAFSASGWPPGTWALTQGTG